MILTVNSITNIDEQISSTVVDINRFKFPIDKVNGHSYTQLVSSKVKPISHPVCQSYIPK